MSGSQLTPLSTSINFGTLGNATTSSVWENARGASATVTLGGTFGGATVVVEGSDAVGGPYTTIAAASGAASFTAAGLAQISIMPRFWRVRSSGGTGSAITAVATLNLSPLVGSGGGSSSSSSFTNGEDLTGRVPVQTLGVLGTGADETAAILTAHNTLVTAGERQAFFPYTSTGYLGTGHSLGNVLFVGARRQLLSPHKWIIPPGTQGPWMPAHDLKPALHFRRVSKALAPRVAIVGDSTTVGTDIATRLNVLGTAVETAIRQANPSRTISFFNYGIGGTTYADLANLAAAPAVTLPSWYTNGSQPWIYYVRDFLPDLVIINLGTNGPVAGTTQANLDAIWNEIAGWSKRPDVLFMTNFPRGTQQDTTTMETALDQRIQSAGMTRNYAAWRGAGLVDMMRAASQMRDGIDVWTTALKRVLDSGADNMGYTFPASFKTTDFAVQFTAANTANAFWQSGAVMRVTLGPLVGGNTQYIEVWRDTGTGNFWTRAKSGAVDIQVDTNTGVSVSSASQIIRIEVLGGRVIFEVDSTRILDIPNFPRCRGPYRPAITWATGGTNNTMGPLSVWIADPAPAMPQMTNTEMFGGTGNDYGGNALNHPCNLSLAQIVERVVSNCDWSFDAAAQPIEQTITAAGTIDLRAGYVALTGPSSGTYAVTLPAPTALERGRSLVVEMTSTTSTNSVTIALTNVIGAPAATTVTFDAARESVVFTAAGDRWVYAGHAGATFS